MQHESEGGVAKQHAVVIAGGGPTGLMLAAELALARVDVAIVERRDSHDHHGMRAGGLHIRTLELLDQRGVVERFISQGEKHVNVPFARTMLDRSDLPTRFQFYLGLWQSRIEHILAEWVAELGVPIHRGCEVVGFAQNDRGVDVELSEGRWLRASYLVGCDGGRSRIRKQAGIEFPGWDASTSYLIAEAESAQEPEWGLRHGQGVNAIGKLGDGRRARMVLQEPQVGSDEPTLRDISERLIAVYGTDYGVRNANYISRFSDMARQAASYRDRRVLLAGDAAHVHSPVGGQGLNIGMQDAVNLGWKLAQVVRGTVPDSLLDSYHAERHPVGARVLRLTMAITALDRPDDRSAALREMVMDMVKLDEPRKQYVARVSGLDVHYDFGDGHPLLGRRMPDLDLIGAQPVFTYLHDAQPMLLNLGEPGAFDIAPWAERVRVVDARYDGAWELPVIGIVAAPAAVLIRPDGHVVWAADGGSNQGLHQALSRWFGPPSAA